MDPEHLQYLKLRLQYELNNVKPGNKSFFELDEGSIERIWVRNDSGGSLAPVVDKKLMHEQARNVFNLDQNGYVPNNIDNALAWNGADYFKDNFPLSDNSIIKTKAIYNNVRNSFKTEHWDNFFNEEKRKAEINGTDLTEKMIEDRKEWLTKAYFFRLCNLTLFDSDLTFKKPLDKKFFGHVCGSNIIKSMFNSFIKAEFNENVNEPTRDSVFDELNNKGTGVKVLIETLGRDGFDLAVSSIIPGSKCMGNGALFMMGEDGQKKLSKAICELMKDLPTDDIKENYNKVIEAIDKGRSAPYEYKAFVKSRFISTSLEYKGVIDIPRETIIQTILDDPYLLNEIMNMPKEQLIKFGEIISHDGQNKSTVQSTVAECQENFINALRGSILNDSEKSDLINNFKKFSENLDNCSQKGIFYAAENGKFNNQQQANILKKTQKKQYIYDIKDNELLEKPSIINMVLSQKDIFDDISIGFRDYLGGDPNDSTDRKELFTMLGIPNDSMNLRAVVSKYDEIYNIIQGDAELEAEYFKKLHDPDRYIAGGDPGSIFEDQYRARISFIINSDTENNKEEFLVKYMLASLEVAGNLPDGGERKKEIAYEILDKLIAEPALLMSLIDTRKNLIKDYLVSNFEADFLNEPNKNNIIDEFCKIAIDKNEVLDQKISTYKGLEVFLKDSNMSVREIAVSKLNNLVQILNKVADDSETYDENDNNKILQFRNEQLLSDHDLLEAYHSLININEEVKLKETISEIIHSRVEMSSSVDDIIGNYKKICNVIDKCPLSELSLEERAALKIQYLNESGEKYQSRKIIDLIVGEMLNDKFIRDHVGSDPETIFNELINESKSIDVAIDKYHKFSKKLNVSTEHEAFIKVKFIHDMRNKFGMVPEVEIFLDIELLKDKYLLKAYQDTFGTIKNTDSSAIGIIQKTINDLEKPKDLIANGAVILTAIDKKAFPTTGPDEESFDDAKKEIRRQYASKLIIKEVAEHEIAYETKPVSNKSNIMAAIKKRFVQTTPVEIKIRLEKHNDILKQIDLDKNMVAEQKNQLKCDYILEYLKFEKQNSVLAKSPMIKPMLKNILSKENLSLLAHISELPKEDRALIASTIVDYFSVSKATKAINKSVLKSNMKNILIGDIQEQLDIKKSQSESKSKIKLIDMLKSLISSKSDKKPRAHIEVFNDSDEVEENFFSKGMEKEFSAIMERMLHKNGPDLYNMESELSENLEEVELGQELYEKICNLNMYYRKYKDMNEGKDFTDCLKFYAQDKKVQSCCEYIVEHCKLNDISSIKDAVFDLIEDPSVNMQL